MTPFRTTSIAGSDMMLTPAPSHSMLEHFDRGFVTSFRQNQDRHRRLSKLPHDPAERASTSRPIRTNHDTVITPLRKRKASRDEAVDVKLNGSGVFNSKIEKKSPRSPHKPRLPPRGFF